MLENYGLREDPFPIVPDGPVHNWAGHSELREDLIDLVKGVRARDIGVTEFVVLYGELGAGKSHALRYLKTLIDEESSKQDGHFKSLALYLERPRVANKLNFLELYKYTIRLIGRERVHSYCQEVKAVVNESAEALAIAAGMGQAKDKSTFHREALERLKANDTPMIKLLYGGAEDATRVYAFLLGEGGAEHNEYEGRVDSDFMAAKVLSDFFRVLTSEIAPQKFILESVYLFIDEGEMLVDAKATESELIFSGLRELINSVPYRFCLVISFSAATALIEAIMPNHLLKRLTRQYFEIPMLNDGDAVSFLGAQINFFRPQDYAPPNPFYPFDEASIRFIVENQTTLTPRNLFIDCKRVMERAIRRYSLAPGETITRDTAATILAGLR